MYPGVSFVLSYSNPLLSIYPIELKKMNCNLFFESFTVENAPFTLDSSKRCFVCRKYAGQHKLSGESVVNIDICSALSSSLGCDNSSGSTVSETNFPLESTLPSDISSVNNFCSASDLTCRSFKSGPFLMKIGGKTSNSVGEGSRNSRTSESRLSNAFYKKSTRIDNARLRAMSVPQLLGLLAMDRGQSDSSPVDWRRSSRQENFSGYPNVSWFQEDYEDDFET